jgi:hypothetical protein
MLLKFENPSNGRFYYLIQHIENNKPTLTIIRGGKKRRVEESYFYNDQTEMERDMERRKKRRIQRGYFQE